MARLIVLDELHVTVFVPRDLPQAECDTIRRTLTGPAFEVRLQRLIRRFFRKEASLGKTKVRLSR
jgi:hypothetical protein